jgi:hypothetical protein
VLALLVLAVLFAGQAALFERERVAWRKERTFLTNTAIARSQTDFVVRQAAVDRPAPKPRPEAIASLEDIPSEPYDGPVTSMPFGL